MTSQLSGKKKKTGVVPRYWLWLCDANAPPSLQIAKSQLVEQILPLGFHLKQINMDSAETLVDALAECLKADESGQKGIYAGIVLDGDLFLNLSSSGKEGLSTDAIVQLLKKLLSHIPLLLVHYPETFAERGLALGPLPMVDAVFFWDEKQISHAAYAYSLSLKQEHKTNADVLSQPEEIPISTAKSEPKKQEAIKRAKHLAQELNSLQNAYQSVLPAPLLDITKNTGFTSLGSWDSHSQLFLMLAERYSQQLAYNQLRRRLNELGNWAAAPKVASSMAFGHLEHWFNYRAAVLWWNNPSQSKQTLYLHQPNPIPLILGEHHPIAPPLSSSGLDALSAAAQWMLKQKGCLPKTMHTTWENLGAEPVAPLTLSESIPMSQTVLALSASEVATQEATWISNAFHTAAVYPFYAGIGSQKICIGACLFFPLEQNQDPHYPDDMVAVLQTEMGTVMHLHHLQTQIKLSSTLDTLTGLHPYSGFITVMEREMKRARRYETPLSLILLDIQRFSEFNQKLGPQGADKLIQEFAHWLKKSFRAFDSVARIGIDRFAILIPDATANQTHFICRRFLKKLSLQEFSGLPTVEPIVLNVRTSIVSWTREIPNAQLFLESAVQQLALVSP